MGEPPLVSIWCIMPLSVSFMKWDQGERKSIAAGKAENTGKCGSTNTYVEVAEARNARSMSSLTLHAANGISLLIVALNAIKTEFLATNENGLRKNWIYDFYKRSLKKKNCSRNWRYGLTKTSRCMESPQRK